MSLASALNVLRPTLPYYLALTKYDLLHLDATTFEFRPHPNAPPVALEMAKTVFTMGASSRIEPYLISFLDKDVLLLSDKRERTGVS
jgi:trehalose-6-phosphatase